MPFIEEDDTVDPTYPRLVGDIGGTNARLAWVAAPGRLPERVKTYACAAYESLESVIRAYLADEGLGVPPWCAIGIANPVTGDWVQMTNHHWAFSIGALRDGLGLQRLLVLNDFTALAMSLPSLSGDDLRLVGGGRAVEGEPRALVGPGTGLGVSGLLSWGGGRLVPVHGEGGHVTLAAADEEEEAVLRVLRRRFGHASAERALSGPGLVHLYDAVCQLRGIAPAALSPAEVSQAGLSAQDPACEQALALFCSFLGTVAGNLALTLGARGGVYIGGGIVPRLGAWFDRSAFRRRFEDKGRFKSYLAEIPTYVVQAAHPALLGAARALDELS
ncbi:MULTISPECIES: glucokinase [Caldimonas]|uniref:glucokinase n=1 Tax=Caldimonas TaxID=196013 RepID=UPI0003758F2A|nr:MULTISPECIES: glucokinase [Caldimonas]GIX25355.1 MAG: glucokinase [Caldimonas sp.]